MYYFNSFGHKIFFNNPYQASDAKQIAKRMDDIREEIADVEKQMLAVEEVS